MLFKKAGLVIYLCLISNAVCGDIIPDVEEAVGDYKNSVLEIQSGDAHLAIDIKTCKSDADCLNGGVCTGDDEAKYCICMDGFQGYFCEIVADLVNEIMCGNSTDVERVHDVKRGKTVCKCLNDTKRFDSLTKTCRVPCGTYSECVEGFCRANEEGLMFCRCFVGTSGDRCEIINGCQNNETDCGDDPDVTCVYGGGKEGKAICKCSQETQSFDDHLKVCKDCDCGERSYGCYFLNGSKTCYCSLQAAQKGATCEACQCGLNSWGCEFLNEKKTCKCLNGYKQRGSRCERCHCGENSKNCEYKNGEKKCSCKPGYAPSNGICIESCNSNRTCKNGGICKETCQCKRGTSGSFCENIDCSAKQCGTNECAYDQQREEAYCACENQNYFFDEYDKTCKDCDCGKNGNCSFQEGVKACSCEEGYDVKNGTCEHCFCGGKGKCVFREDGSKSCLCDYGFSERLGECAKCSCGPNGSCSFDMWLKKCDCDNGYKETEGYCKECDCGNQGDCVFVNGQKKCKCKPQYGEKEGKCQACNCGNNANCTFYEEANGRNKIKNCICPEGFEDKKGTCADIDECQDSSVCPISTVCINDIGGYNCICKGGYRPINPNSDPKIHGCEEINECLKPNLCPPTTICEDHHDGYACVCPKGYSLKYIKPNVLRCEEFYKTWRDAYMFLCLAFVAIFTVVLALFLCRSQMSYVLCNISRQKRAEKKQPI